jgi:predicted transcriptional regulator
MLRLASGMGKPVERSAVRCSPATLDVPHTVLHNEIQTEIRSVIMAAMSLRLSEALDAKLDDEAKRAGLARSELARTAIAEYLTRRERERFVAGFVAEARAAYGDEKIRDEARSFAEDALAIDNEAGDLAAGLRKGRAAVPPHGGKRK